MANSQNLKLISSTEQAREYGRRGGRVKSPKKTLAAQISGLKKRGLSDMMASKLYDELTNPDFSALDIKMYLEKIKADCKTPNQQLVLSQTLIQWHKAHHGEKQKIESRNMNVNVNIESDLNTFQSLLSQYSQQESITGEDEQPKTG